MKKISILSLIALMAFTSFASARTIYDSTGRNIVKDDTLRGQKRAIEQQRETQRKMQAAAAAKIDYEKALKSLEQEKPKPNFYQDRIK